MSDAWIPIYSASDALVVQGKLEACGVPTVMRADGLANLGYAIGPIGAGVICVPPDRLDEAHEILGLPPQELVFDSPADELESADDPPDYQQLVELAKLGVRIQYLAILSLCGLPLLACVPGAWMGLRYLNEAGELRGRPRSHGLTIIAIGVCVLAIPFGIWLIAYWIG